jgi:hypothetical protein
MFQDLVIKELERARGLYPGIHSTHEALGVILEEFEEFKDEVKKKQIDKTKMLAELVQVAAMCQKSAEDLNLMPVQGL